MTNQNRHVEQSTHGENNQNWDLRVLTNSEGQVAASAKQVTAMSKLFKLPGKERAFEWMV